jgi:hypothetical protein
MEVANTLAYYNTATITAVKSFIVQAPAFPIIEQGVLNKSSSLLVIQEQNTQILQFTEIIKTEKYLQKLFKTPRAWVQRPVGLIKSGRKFKHFRR